MNHAYTMPRTPQTPRRKEYSFVPRTPTAKMPRTPNTKRIKFANTFSPMDKGNFGKDAIKITIGNRMTPPRDPFQNPGPSDYYPRDIETSRKIYHTFAKSKKEENNQTLTSNIGFIIPPKEKTVVIQIPKSERPPIYQISDTPGYVYNIPEPSSPRGHKIANRQSSVFRSDDENTKIGPGTYSPPTSTLTRSCQVNMHSNPKRGDWMIGPQLPAPGQYSPNEIKVNEPSYIIGKRSRPKKRYDGTEERVKTRIFAIDAFIINLPVSFDEKDVLLYLTENPGVRDFLHEIGELVLSEKPDDPIGFIRNAYSQFRTTTKDPFSVKKNIAMF